MAVISDSEEMRSRMIEEKDILSIGYLKKTSFSGSYKGMRYRLEKEQGETETDLLARCWEEPYSLSATEENQITAERFPFSQEGIAEAVAWLNQMYIKNEERYLEAKKNWKRP